MIYLASPYSHDNPVVREGRVRDVCTIAAGMMREGHLVYSPIAHGHAIAEAGQLPGGWDYWRKHDAEMLRACAELWVVMLPGWEQSRGVQAEIAMARAAGVVIRYVGCDCDGSWWLEDDGYDEDEEDPYYDEDGYYDDEYRELPQGCPGG